MWTASTRSTLTGLSGATTANPRYLRVGIEEYAGSSTQPVTVYHAHVATSTTDWLGAPGGGGGDTTPPGVPSGLGGSASGPTSVSLNWNDVSAADLAGYNVFRSASESGTYSKLNGSVVSASQFTDSTAPANTTSWYKVSSVDMTGNESAQSVAVSVTTPAPSDTTPPGVPGGLGGTASSATSVDLNWNDVSAADLAGYNVFRSAAESRRRTTKLNGSVVVPSQYTDSSAPAGTTSWCKVSSVDTTGNEIGPVGGGERDYAAHGWRGRRWARMSRFTTDAGCRRCQLVWNDPELKATIRRAERGGHGLAIEMSAARPVCRASVHRTCSGSSRGRRWRVELFVFEVVDVTGKVVYELFLNQARLLRLKSPAGGLGRLRSIVDGNHESEQRHGGSGRGVGASQRLGGRSCERRRQDHPDRPLGATTGQPALPRVGIEEYAGSSTQPVTVYHANVGTSTTTWLGAP